MTEEALDPAPSAGEESSAETRPRPRRRRRGGRGRGRGGGQSRPAATQERRTESAEGAPGGSGEARGGSSPRPTETGPEPPRRRSREASGAGSRPRVDQQASAESKPKDGEGDTRPARRRTRRGSRGRGRGRRPSATKPEAAPEDGQATQHKQPSEAAKRPEAPRERPPRRRRGGRPAERARAAADTADTAPAPDTADTAQAPDTGAEKPPAPKRRRRRRKPTAAAPAAAEAENLAEPVTEEKAPQPRRGRTARATGAPTRTSRQARRTAADRRRHQPMVQVDRRTQKTMLMTEQDGRLQIVVLEGRDLMEHYVTRSGAQSMVGNIYLGRVQNVLPGMEAAFVDVGRGRNAVLYAGEVSYDEDVERGDRRIEAVLKPGQSVLVQVTKDPLRGKGPRLTAQISVPGRYLVYVPDGGASGISRRLPDAERERLRKIVKRIRPSEAGVIVRTAAEGASEEELAADLDRLKKAWEAIKRRSKRGKGPKALYEEPELVERVVRDVFSPTEFAQIVTDSPEVFERVTGYLRDVAPDLLDRVKLHDGKLALFEAFHVSEQIHKALERKVWLPSGGYLVIDRTEAMTVIDVNTGKAVGKRNLEETVTATNLEAATEIPRQLRLRDIGGIIVIDFIDMMLATNRDRVVQTLREELAHDKTRSQVFDITALGLLEMTRKKVSAGLVEAFSEPCPTCEGRGILLTHESSGGPMYAVIRVGGKQERVKPGDVIEVDFMQVDPGSAVEFRPMVVVDDDGNAHYGKDLSKAKVVARLLGDKKGDKLRVFKYRSKSGYRKTQGHRQMLTLLEIHEVGLDRDRVARREEPAAEPEATPKKGAGKEPAAAEKKTGAKKPAAKKPAAKKAAAKKPTAKKPTAKKSTAKKTTERKSTAKRSTATSEPVEGG